MQTAVRSGLANLPATRRAILDHLKRHGEARAETIAAATSITISGARQHLVTLERDGLITYREQRDGPGRPRHLYRLSLAGEALFPRAYAELTNELLQYVEHEDPAMLDRIFDRRGRRRLEQAQVRTAGLSFEQKVRVLVAILDEDGYLADFQRRDDGSYLITEHNCAVLSVAQRYQHACGSELTFLQAALPDASVVRVAHRLAGAHVCAYEVRPLV